MSPQELFSSCWQKPPGRKRLGGVWGVLALMGMRKLKEPTWKIRSREYSSGQKELQSWGIRRKTRRKRLQDCRSQYSGLIKTHFFVRKKEILPLWSMLSLVSVPLYWKTVNRFASMEFNEQPGQISRQSVSCCRRDGRTEEESNSNWTIFAPHICSLQFISCSRQVAWDICPFMQIYGNDWFSVAHSIRCHMKNALEKEQLVLLWGCIRTTQVYMLLRDEEHQKKRKKKGVHWKRQLSIWPGSNSYSQHMIWKIFMREREFSRPLNAAFSQRLPRGTSDFIFSFSWALIWHVSTEVSEREKTRIQGEAVSNSPHVPKHWHKSGCLWTPLVEAGSSLKQFDREQTAGSAPVAVNELQCHKLALQQLVLK